MMRIERYKVQKEIGERICRNMHARKAQYIYVNTLLLVVLNIAE